MEDLEDSSIMTQFKFLDDSSSSKYACDVCSTICTQAQLAECCGATYCKKCAEIAESSASIQAEGRSSSQLDIIRSNPSASVCSKCRAENLQFVSDHLVQDCISKLQVQCLNPGCGWLGNFGDAESHMKEPHDREEELYDNDFLLEGDSVEPPPDQEQSTIKSTSYPAHATSDNTATPRYVSGPGTQRPPATAEITDDTEKKLASSISQLEEQTSDATSASKQENVCLRFYSRTHSEEFTDLSAAEKL